MQSRPSGRDPMSESTGALATHFGPSKDADVAAALGRRRRRSNTVIETLCTVATIVGLLLLASILMTLFWRGFAGLSLAVFTTTTKPPGSNGGSDERDLGSFIQTTLGTAMGRPSGCWSAPISPSIPRTRLWEPPYGSFPTCSCRLPRS